MIQYKNSNVKLSNLQLNKLKSRRENCTKIALETSSNVVVDSNNENNFLHKLLLANTPVSKFCKDFENNSSANMKLSKTQLHIIWQSGGVLGRPLGPLLTTGLSLIGNVLKPLTKSVLTPLGLASGTDAPIHKKNFWIWRDNVINF